MRPQPPACICGRTACERSTNGSRLSFNACSQPSRGTLRKGPAAGPPVFPTKMSRPPNLATTSSTAGFSVARSVRSIGTARHRPRQPPSTRPKDPASQSCCGQQPPPARPRPPERAPRLYPNRVTQPSPMHVFRSAKIHRLPTLQICSMGADLTFGTHDVKSCRQ